MVLDGANTHCGGVAQTTTFALASSFLAENYGAPAMLFALFIGLVFSFMNDWPRATAGIDFSSRTLLRCGVALLALR